MLSSMNCALQTDLFARSLRSKLVSLSPVHLDYEKENPRGIGGITPGTRYFSSGTSTCDDMMLINVNQKPLFGNFNLFE